jgi:hypothetical protein
MRHNVDIDLISLGGKGRWIDVNGDVVQAPFPFINFISIVFKGKSTSAFILAHHGTLILRSFLVLLCIARFSSTAVNHIDAGMPSIFFITSIQHFELVNDPFVPVFSVLCPASEAVKKQ